MIPISPCHGQGARPFGPYTIYAKGLQERQKPVRNPLESPKPPHSSPLHANLKPSKASHRQPAPEVVVSIMRVGDVLALAGGLPSVGVSFLPGFKAVGRFGFYGFGLRILGLGSCKIEFCAYRVLQLGMCNQKVRLLRAQGLEFCSSDLSQISQRVLQQAVVSEFSGNAPLQSPYKCLQHTPGLICIHENLYRKLML